MILELGTGEAVDSLEKGERSPFAFTAGNAHLFGTFVLLTPFLISTEEKSMRCLRVISRDVPGASLGTGVR